MEKLARRKWLNPCSLRISKEDEEKIAALNLPVPTKSPALLNLLPDFKMKSSFFRMLGLKAVPSHVQQGN